MRELLNEVARKSLEKASGLLDRENGWSIDDSHLVRSLVDIAVTAGSAIHPSVEDTIQLGFPSRTPKQRELDREELKTAILNILKKETEGRGDLDYT